MESTDDFADKEGDWSDADDNVDDGAVEGFDDEHWDCDGSKGTANADTPGIAVESSGTLQNIASAVSASAGPASAEAEAVSSEKCAVDKDDASAEDTAKDPETSGKWGIGSTLTAFAGALQQVRNFVSMRVCCGPVFRVSDIYRSCRTSRKFQNQ